MNRKLSRLNAALVLGALVGIMILAGGCGSSALVPTATIPLPAKMVPTTEPPPAVGDGSVILAGEDDAITRRVRVSTSHLKFDARRDFRSPIFNLQSPISNLQPYRV